MAVEAAESPPGDSFHEFLMTLGNKESEHTLYIIMVYFISGKTVLLSTSFLRAEVKRRLTSPEGGPEQLYTYI